jgi:hypothetical protein
MAWMADGKRFKHSRRVGEKVVTSYLQGSEARELAAEIASRKKRLEAAREELKKLRQEDVTLMQDCDLVSESIVALSQGLLLTLGHHCHRGTWRIRRAGLRTTSGAG